VLSTLEFLTVYNAPMFDTLRLPVTLQFAHLHLVSQWSSAQCARSWDPIALWAIVFIA